MILLIRGSVYRYFYLWAWQSDYGEESGRKERPACLLVRPPSHPELMFMFAITSKMPPSNRSFDLIPAAGCRRVGLSHPSWIILDEYNIAVDTDLQDFASLEPLGTFSAPYLKTVILKALARAKQTPTRAIDRN